MRAKRFQFWSVRYGALAAVMFVAACAGQNQDLVTGVSPATPEPAPPAPAIVTPPVLEPPVISADSTRLLAMRPAEVQALLGTPSLLRRDGNIQVALYEVATCVLDISYFSSALDQPFKVNHLTARTPLGAPASADDCLTEILPGGVVPLALQAPPPQLVENDQASESGPSSTPPGSPAPDTKDDGSL